MRRTEAGFGGLRGGGVCGYGYREDFFFFFFPDVPTVSRMFSSKFFTLWSLKRYDLLMWFRFLELSNLKL